MQNVRIILKDDPNPKGTVYIETQVSINFITKIVSIWNGVYWKETPFEELKVIATWDEE